MITDSFRRFRHVNIDSPNKSVQNIRQARHEKSEFDHEEDIILLPRSRNIMYEDKKRVFEYCMS